MDGGFFELESDPTEVDSDNDGLDDYEETDGTHTVQYTDSPQDSQQFLNALYGDEDPGSYLDADSNVRTDPLNADTDDDGLRDGEELELGTNPNAADTDGDGLDDAEELDRDTDPTLHDYEPPEISVLRANFFSPSGSASTTYDLRYSASDATGVASTAVVQDSDVRDTTEHDDYPDGVRVNTRFETGAGESLFDGVFGTTVQIRASDRHDNTHERVGLERSNFYGTLAGKLGPMASTDTATDLGLLSGFTAGMGGTARTVDALLEDPFGFVDGLVQLVEVMDDLGLIAKLLAAMPQQMVEEVQEKQDRNNPYDPQTEAERYEAFESGYYAGYSVYFLASLVVGDQATKSIKGPSQFQSLVDKLDSNGRVTQANRYLDAVKGRTTGPVKKGGYKLGARVAKGSYHLSSASAQRILSGARTAVGQARLYRAIRQIDGHKLDDLSRSQETNLRELLARSSDDGVTVLNRLDSDSTDRLLRMSGFCGVGDVSTSRIGGGSCLKEETVDDFRVAVAKASAESDLSSTELESVLQNVYTLDGEDRRQAIRFIAETNTDGVETVNGLNGNEITRLLSIVYKGEVPGESPELIDDELTATDMVELTNEKITLDETMGVVKPQNPYSSENVNTVWLEDGQLGSAAGKDDWVRDTGGTGWKHIRHNHFDNPNGNQFSQSFGPKYEDSEEVKKLIIESIRKGEPVNDDGDIIYVYEMDGKVVSTVVGDNGYIVTSTPGDLTT